MTEIIIISAIIGGFIGAIAGVLVDSLYKRCIENFSKFAFRRCDAVLMMTDISKESVLNMIPLAHTVSPIRVGSELYWGLTFENNISLCIEDLLGNSCGYIYLTIQGRKKITLMNRCREIISLFGLREAE